MLKKLVLLLTTLLFLCQSIYAVDSKHYSSVEAMVKDQKVIRIGIDEAGGFGDIAASASIMKRLRQMGFDGTFEAVYPDRSKKVATLFDLPLSNLPDSYNDEKDNIHFIKLTEFENRYKKHTNEQVLLGLTGWLYTYSISDSLTYAQGFNTSVFAAINNDLGYSITSITTLDGKVKNLDNSKTFFMMPIANFEQAKAYLQTAKGQELLTKKPALQTYLEGMENQDFNVLPVYGYTITAEYTLDDGYVKNILEIIAGARYAQRYTNSDWRNKPLVIAVFYDYEAEAMVLDQLIHSNNWGNYESSTAPQARAVIKQLELDQADVFSVASLSDPKTITKIKNLKNGQILLLSMGAFPKDVFDGIYTHTGDNIWPQIREGLSSFSSLVLTGKPHFRCRSNWYQDWEIGFDLVQDPLLKTKLENFYKQFCYYHDGSLEDKVWDDNNTAYQTLGELISDAHDPNSAFSHYFQQLKTEAAKPENDRLYYTLETMMAIVNASN